MSENRETYIQCTKAHTHTHSPHVDIYVREQVSLSTPKKTDRYQIRIKVNDWRIESAVQNWKQYTVLAKKKEKRTHSSNRREKKKTNDRSE